ncbi:MAG TPA: hypothetical protein VGD51_18480, partial [Nocardioidaceae bacterium]
MSEYWLNRIGIASSVTTPTGSVPQYGLAADIGTAQWPDSATFNQWAQDAVATERAGEIAEAEYEAEQADESGWFQNLLKDFTGAIGQIDLNPFNGSNQGIISEDEFESAALKPEDYERGGERMEAFANAPGIKQLNQAWEAGTRPVETGFLMYRNAEMRRRLGGFFDRSSWGAAWREAEERTLGEAFADAMFVEYGDTNADLDRRRRTNSLYGMTAFASELYAGFKADPTVIAGKGLGEVGRIKRGELPRGYTSTKAAAAATKAARAEDPSAVAYDGGLLERYGTWRGKTVASRYDALRVLAENMDFTEFSNLPMFRRKAVNGPQAALAFKIAAKDDKLWDLTRRATLADPEAWAEINAMKAGLTDELNAASGTDAANYIDAIEATKTKMGQLDNEIADLEKKIALREELGPQSPTGRPGKGINEGFFKYHTWELDRDLESKMLDVANMDAMLNRYDDYATWLGKIEDEGVWANVEGVSTKGLPDRLNYVNSKTYQKSPFGPVHRVSEITRAGWLRTANAIDLHRVDSGTMSIRRQFEQFAHFFNYYDRAAMDDAMVRFTKAKDPLERFKIAREIEDTHLPQAVAQKYGLEPETVDTFLRQTRLRRNEMAEALLSGKGAVYDTTPGLADSAELVAVKDGMATVRVMDNGKLHTMRLPEEALQPQPDLPVDITQTPNYYSPMDTRQVDLAIKRNPELFELLDSD